MRGIAAVIPATIPGRGPKASAGTVENSDPRKVSKLSPIGSGIRLMNNPSREKVKVMAIFRLLLVRAAHRSSKG